MNNLSKWIAATVATALALFLIWYFHIVVEYILIAMVLSLMGKPLVTVLCRIKIYNWDFPKWLAATVTLITLFTLILAAIGGFIPLIFTKASDLSAYNLTDISNTITEPLQSAEALIHKHLPASMSNLSFRQIIEDYITPIFTSQSSIINNVTSLTSGIIDFVLALFCIAFITFFFLKEDELFNDGIVILFPKRYEANIRRAIQSITTLLSRYFVGLLIECTIKLICITVALVIVGFSFNDSVIIALISSVLNVIPYVGPLVGAGIGMLFGAISPVEGVAMGTLMLEMGIIFLAFQIFDNVIIQPYIYSSSVKAHPLEIFLVILMAGYIAGVWGMLLAIPAYTVLRVFAKEFFNNLRLVQKLTENI